MTYKKDISIPMRLFSIPDPVRVIAATLVHELATSTGPPGGWRARQPSRRCRRAASTISTTPR